jgi:threonyl-tRNA synthetase
MIEHYAGEFPLWLAPIQAVVLPIADEYLSYAASVAATFREAGVRVELDERNEKIGYKIRDWEMKKVGFMVIVGEKERSAGNISVRQHKKGDLGSMDPKGFLNRLVEAIKTKSLTL